MLLEDYFLGGCDQITGKRAVIHHREWKWINLASRILIFSARVKEQARGSIIKRIEFGWGQLKIEPHFPPLNRIRDSKYLQFLGWTWLVFEHVLGWVCAERVRVIYNSKSSVNFPGVHQSECDPSLIAFLFGKNQSDFNVQHVGTFDWFLGFSLIFLPQQILIPTGSTNDRSYNCSAGRP